MKDQPANMADVLEHLANPEIGDYYVSTTTSPYDWYWFDGDKWIPVVHGHS